MGLVKTRKLVYARRGLHRYDKLAISRLQKATTDGIESLKI